VKEQVSKFQGFKVSPGAPDSMKTKYKVVLLLLILLAAAGSGGHLRRIAVSTTSSLNRKASAI
jgi:hypothetical protein